MDKDMQSMVGEIDFDYDKDRKEFGAGDRIVRLISCVNEEGIPVISLIFNLGREEDDSITLQLNSEEFIQKFLITSMNGEDYSGGK
jgi:hypothetical protein